MLSAYEALEALKKAGTMGKAGAMLRISQSAVSKRIATLEGETGKTLIEKNGRRVSLTAEAEHLINKIGPLLADIRHELKLMTPIASSELQLGVSESVLASWGAAVLKKAEQAMQPTTLNIHAHRGPLLTQLTMSGTYIAAIIAGEPGNLGSLSCIELGQEPMVIISGKDNSSTLISIEPQAATWQSISRKATKAGLLPNRYVESYFAAASLAVAGFGSALIPAGVAMSVKLPRQIKTTPAKNLSRPISILARKHVLERNEMLVMIKVIREELKNATWRS